MDRYSKSKVLEIPNINEKHVIASQKISFLKPATNYLRFFRIEQWSRDILRDLLKEPPLQQKDNFKSQEITVTVKSI